MLKFFHCYLVSSHSHRKIIKALFPSERWRAWNNFLPKPGKAFPTVSVAIPAKHTASDMQWQMSFIKLNTKHTSATKTERHWFFVSFLTCIAQYLSTGLKNGRLIVGKYEVTHTRENNLWVHTDNQDVCISSYHWRKSSWTVNRQQQSKRPIESWRLLRKD